MITGVKFKFPMSNDDVVTLVAYMMARVKLKAVTIDKYLSGLRLKNKTKKLKNCFKNFF